MQILINGFLQGILFGAVGVAFALVYRTTKVFYIALGGVYALAPYFLLSALEFDVPLVVGIMLALALSMLISILAEETIHWPFERKRSPTEVHLIGSLGFYLVLVQVIALVWGNEIKVLKPGGDTTWELFGVILVKAQLFGPLLALSAVLLLFIWLTRANRGLELRALADNPILVALLGRNIRALRRWVFGLSGALVAVVALGQAWDVGFDPHVGLNTVLLGMVAMIIGGSTTFVGPLIGGILLGILRSQVVWYGSARWEDAATFVLLALFLFLRPQGIFGRKQRLEEAG